MRRENCGSSACLMENNCRTKGKWSDLVVAPSLSRQVLWSQAIHPQNVKDRLIRGVGFFSLYHKDCQTWLWQALGRNVSQSRAFPTMNGSAPHCQQDINEKQSFWYELV